MKMHYTVHSAVVEPVMVTAMLGGSPVVATVPGLTVELVSEGDAHHGHTFRFVPKGEADMAAHQERFMVGAKVTATFTADEGDVV